MEACEKILSVTRIVIGRVILESMSYIVSVEKFILLIEMNVEDLWMMTNIGLNKILFGVDINSELIVKDNTGPIRMLDEMDNNIDKEWKMVLENNIKPQNQIKDMESIKDENEPQENNAKKNSDWSELASDIADNKNNVTVVSDENDENSKLRTSVNTKYIQVIINRLHDVITKIKKGAIKIMNKTKLFATMMYDLANLIYVIVSWDKKSRKRGKHGRSKIKKSVSDGEKVDDAAHEKMFDENTDTSNCDDEKRKEIYGRLNKIRRKIGDKIKEYTEQEVDVIIGNENLIISAIGKQEMVANSVILRLKIKTAVAVVITLRIMPRHVFDLYEVENNAIGNYTIIGKSNMRVVMIKIKMSKVVSAVLITKITKAASKVFAEMDDNSENESIAYTIDNCKKMTEKPEEIVLMRNIQKNNVTFFLSNVYVAQRKGDELVIIDYTSSTMTPISGDIAIINEEIYMCYARCNDKSTVMMSKLLG